MPERHEPRAPALLRWLVRVASWMVAQAERRAWRSRWEAQLAGWRALVERGDLTERSWREMARLLRGAAGQAFRARAEREHVRQVLNGPLFVVCAGGGLLILLGLLSRGFAATRAIAGVFHVMLFPPATLPAGAIPRHGGDTVFAFTVPIAFAVGVTAMALTFRHLHPRSWNWRYWLFLGAKFAVALTLVTLAWIEISALVRVQLPQSTFRVLLTGLAFRVIYAGAFVRMSIWCLTDQQRRCPICLQRLAAPVSIGNCANCFEPAVTELLCERGHGALSVPEVEGGEPDRWTAFDASWSELFTTRDR